MPVRSGMKFGVNVNGGRVSCPRYIATSRRNPSIVSVEPVEGNIISASMPAKWTMDFKIDAGAERDGKKCVIAINAQIGLDLKGMRMH